MRSLISSLISLWEQAKSVRNGVASAATAVGPPASAAAPAPTVNRPDTLPAQQLISPNTGLWQVSRVPWKTVKLFSSNSLPALSIPCSATSASLNSVEDSRTIGSQYPLIQ